MDSEDVILLKNGYGALARRDYPAFLDLLHPDIEWIGTSAGEAVVHRGHEDVLREVLHRLPPEPERFRLDPEEFLEAGDRLVVLGHERVVDPAEGVLAAIPFVHVWTMRGGSAVRFRAYFAAPPVAHALASGREGRVSGA